MLTFREITTQDQPRFDAFFRNRDTLGCHENFATIYLWAKLYRQEWCDYEGWILVNTSENFNYPFGSGDLRVPLDAMMEHSRAVGIPLTLWGMNDEEKERMEALYPGQFLFEETRQYADYLYDARKLADLSGKKLHSKRNFINRFMADYPDWSFEPLTHENLEDAMRMSAEWCKINDCGRSAALKEEACAVGRAFRHYWDLGLTGGLLRAGGRVVAFSMASPLGTRAFDIHIEKAFYDVPGAYPMINREMARYILEQYPHVELINREDDTGDEGLRKAKLSYYPEILLRKWLATWIGG